MPPKPSSDEQDQKKKRKITQVAADDDDDIAEETEADGGALHFEKYPPLLPLQATLIVVAPMPPTPIIKAQWPHAASASTASTLPGQLHGCSNILSFNNTSIWLIEA